MPVLARLFSEGFRIFFLLTLLSAVLFLSVWEGLLWNDFFGSGGWSLPILPGPIGWHAHEMIFGFAGAAMGGFFLTAVPNWTGAPAAQRSFIAIAAGLWLLGRIAAWTSALWPAGLVALASLLFVPFLGAKIATQLLKRPKPQNMMFLGILAAMWGGEVLVQADWMGLGWGDEGRGLRVGLLALCAMIAVIGGRVVPAFTRNAMIRTGRETDLPESGGRLDLAGIGVTVALALLAVLPLPEMLPALLALVAGGLTLARLSRWKGLWSRPYPIIWTLHLSYALLGLGYLAWGAAGFGIGAEIPALHLLGIGAVGGMVLSVMSRASLGHTGRPLIAARPVALAYGIVPIAALIRWIAPQATDGEAFLTLFAGILWITAFGLALAAVAPILLAPRMPRPPVGPAPGSSGRPN